jgi:hypothetical protein
VKNAGDVFTDTFVFFRKSLGPICLAALAGTAIFTTGAFLLAKVPAEELFAYKQEFFGVVQTVPDFFSNNGNAWLYPLAVLAVSVVVFVTQFLLKGWRFKAAEMEGDKPESTGNVIAPILFGFLKTTMMVAIFSLMFLLPGWTVYFIMPFAFPVFFLGTQVMVYEGGNFFSNIGRTMELLVIQFGQMLGVFLILFITGFLFFLLLDSGLLWFLLDVIGMNFYLTDSGAQVFETVAVTSISVFFLLVIFSLWVTGTSLQYFSILEATEAFFLKKRLELIGKRERIRGLERES